MWAQLIKTRLKPGKEAGLERLYQHLRATEQPGSGLVRSTAMRNQKDPHSIYMLVVFESEEKARARERDPRRQEGALHDRVLVEPAYEQRMLAELDDVVAAIPRTQLAIQWTSRPKWHFWRAWRPHLWRIRGRTSSSG